MGWSFHNGTMHYDHENHDCFQQEHTRSKIVAIVAAYNEGPRIQKVIEVLSSYPRFDKIVIIDDGSTDDTYIKALAVKYENMIVHTQPNNGKGSAMELGVQLSDPDIIFFCDADILGLTHEMIDETLAPVLERRVGMMIAMRDRGLYWHLPYTIEMAAKLGGERALTRELWESVPAKFKSHYMIETALNYVADRSSGFDFKIMPGLSQVIKEQKRGFFLGFLQRIKMIYDVVKAHIVLRVS